MSLSSLRITVRCLLLLTLPTVTITVAAEHGEVVYRADFDAADCLQDWEPAEPPGVSLARLDGGSQCLAVERSADDTLASRGVRRRLPIEKLRGTLVLIEAKVKADNVAEPPNPWNGIECMLHTISPGGQRWQQKNSVFGTFDFKPIRFVAEVPPDATEAWIVLGLEQTTGRVWFDDLRISTIASRRAKPTEKPAEPAYKGHNLPRLRGAMIGQVDEADLRVLGGAWKANHVRWQLIWGGFPRSPADNADVETYNRWLESQLQRIDRLLPVCRELGMLVLIDLHTPPGGRNPANECRIFKEQRFQQAFVDVWQRIARRYRGNPTVWGYDLVNEPVEGVVGQRLMDWHALATHTAKQVRTIDPDHAIVVEPAPWGSPASLAFFEPLNVPGVVYSVHMYQPHRFTHQGIYGNPAGVRYPGRVDGRHWDRATLEHALKPAIDYQRDYGVHIYLGEFSAIRWAPGDSAHDYLSDCIAIFEQHGWDWAYHAFREWDGWSVEHGPDRDDHRPSREPTDREKLLRRWFEQNRKHEPSR